MILKREFYSPGYVTDANGKNSRQVDQQHFSSSDGSVIMCLSGPYKAFDFVDIEVKEHVG